MPQRAWQLLWACLFVLAGCGGQGANPEPTVDSYLAAYNQHDLDAVLALVAEDAPYIAYPDSVLGRGNPWLRVELPRQWRPRTPGHVCPRCRQALVGHAERAAIQSGRRRKCNAEIT